MIRNEDVTAVAARALSDWFEANRRTLPWRLELAGTDGAAVAEVGPAYAAASTAVQSQEASRTEVGRTSDRARQVKPGLTPSKATASVAVLPTQAASTVSACDKAQTQETAAVKTGSPTAKRDPYRTWISEIMLQQTQVSTVIDYFNRWMTRFPDVHALARAREEDVLEAWAGLGYYSRARNILVTGKIVAGAHRGVFPWKRDDLLGLKGIGDYTAGAIASLAYNLPEPILDGNLVRVFSRLYGMAFLPDHQAGKKAYWDLAKDWVESHVPALVNEGLMELGALICTPRQPACSSCPLAGFCLAHAEGRQHELPPAKNRSEPKSVVGFAVIASRGKDVLLYQPRKPELLAGLLTFPVIIGADLAALRKEWKKVLPNLAQATLRPRAVTVTHSITHHQYKLKLAEVEVETTSRDLPDGYAWVARKDLARKLVSSLPKKIWKAYGSGAPDAAQKASRSG